MECLFCDHAEDAAQERNILREIAGNASRRHVNDAILLIHAVSTRRACAALNPLEGPTFVFSEISVLWEAIYDPAFHRIDSVGIVAWGYHALLRRGSI
jgi:hypothetical protein